MARHNHAARPLDTTQLQQRMKIKVSVLGTLAAYGLILVHQGTEAAGLRRRLGGAGVTFSHHPRWPLCASRG
jgi:hypothetical protein